VIPSFHGLREGGDDNYGVGVGGEKVTSAAVFRRDEVVAKWYFLSLQRPF
jgi:hypothetical protein